MHYLIKECFPFLTPNGNQLLTLLRQHLTLKNFHIDLLSTVQTMKQLDTVNTESKVRTFLKTIAQIPLLVWMQNLNSYRDFTKFLILVCIFSSGTYRTWRLRTVITCFPESPALVLSLCTEAWHTA